MTRNHYRKKRRRAIVSIVALSLFVILVFVGGGRVGLFATMTLTTEMRPAGSVLGVPHTGTYSKVSRVIEERLDPLLQRRDVALEPGTPCALIYDLPWDAPKRDRRSLAGRYSSDPTLAPQGGVTTEVLTEREVLVASIEADPSVAGFKLFPRIKKWLASKNYEVDGPVLELYGEDGVVRVLVPFRPKK